MATSRRDFAALEARGPAGAEGRGAGRAQTEAQRRGGGRGRRGAPSRPGRAGVPHGSVDAAAGRGGHHATHGRPAPSRTRLADLAAAGVVPPASSPARAGAGRGGDRTVEDAALGAAKKTPAAATRGSSSKTKVASRSSPSSAGPGPPAARP